LFKKISIEYKKYDGIQVITPKSQRVELFIQIVEELVLKPKLAKHMRKQQQHNQTINVSSIVADNNVSGSIINDDTTSILNNDLSNDMNITVLNGE
jgi:hypothetical protein